MTGPSTKGWSGAPDGVREHNVDGVPVFCAPLRDRIIGGICFRVGFADEDFGNHGITHLVEHLALHGQLQALIHSNGMTSDLYTTFYATGTESEVVDFLTRVCDGLTHLPLDRVEVEKDILRTEEIRHGGVIPDLRVARHGLRDFGLSGIRELGLARIGPNEVAAWAADRFTTGNAAAFLTVDEVPSDLVLRLPAGPLRAVPIPSQIIGQRPAWSRTHLGRVAFDALVDRSTGSWVFEELVQRALFRDLREEGGLTYAVETGLEAINPEGARLTVVVDALPQKVEAVAGGVVDTLARLRFGTIDEDELDEAKAVVRRDLEQPDYVPQYLPQMVMLRLIEASVPSLSERLAAVEAVTAKDIQTAARSVWADAVFALPANRLDWAGVEQAPAPGEGDPVVGHVFLGVGNPDVRLVCGASGVTLFDGDQTTTILYDAVVGLITWPDGGRTLHGADGASIAIEPTLYAGLTASLAAALVDSRVPAERTVPFPARPQESIPRPPEPSAAPAEPPDYVPAAPTSVPWTVSPSYQILDPAASIWVPPEVRAYPPTGYGPSPWAPAPAVPPAYGPASWTSGPGPYATPGLPQSHAVAPPPSVWPGWVSPVPVAAAQPRRVGLFVLCIFLCLVFGVAALICGLVLAVYSGDATLPHRASTLKIFAVLFVMTVAPAIACSRLAYRYSQRRS
jgi:hypothetical protein